jgi:DNA polymerase
MILAPPKLSDLRAGHQLVAGLGISTVLPDFDFETYSPAGFVWNPSTKSFKPPEGANKKGLMITGMAAYSEHPDCELLSMAYDLKDGHGRRLWIPGYPAPTDLFQHIYSGGLLEAWNVGFESWIWDNVCVPKYNFIPLPHSQLRCAMAKSRAHALPGSLADAGNVLNIHNKKMSDGKRLLDKFSIPRNPTKGDCRTRVLPSEDPADARLLYEYNLRDIEAEAEISSMIPDLSPFELTFWQIDQAINRRGVAMDRDAIMACILIVDQAHEKYNAEIRVLTDGAVQYASEVQKIRAWLMERGVHAPSLTGDVVTELLSIKGLHYDVKRVLQIRDSLGSVAVSKLYTMMNQISRRDRLHDLFMYHSARTGRAAGRGVQPQNLPNSGIDVNECKLCACYCVTAVCLWCGNTWLDPVEWNPRAVENAIEVIKTGSLDCVEMFFGDAIATVSSCIRGMFVSSQGHDLICSDYSAIEAVVLACMSGEEWQIEVFKTHGKIYEATASKLTGMPVDEMLLYKATSGHHHEYRRLGKLASLASGYSAWVGGWKKFGADEFLTDDEIVKAILAWREASPAIVEFWGGQEKRWKPCLYGVEGTAIQAILNPGTKFSYRSISYLMSADVLYCTIPSGRHITYHSPRLRPSERRAGTYAISFMGMNTNPLQGAYGWVRMDTYAGKLTENIIQAVARDILAHAIVNLEKAGYPVVLHVHDEIVCEVPENLGSVEEFERIMSTMPEWAKDWPIVAKGGWRAKRYAK